MNGLLKDLRFGARMLVRTPLLSGVAVLTVGLGVGATTFAFSVVYGTLLREPPVRDVDRLVALTETRPAEGEDQIGVPYHDYRDFLERQTSFEILRGAYTGTINLAGDAGPPERFDGGFVTVGFLEMLGIPPLHGRTFREGEDDPGAPPTLVLGYDAWRNRFAADPEVVGRTVRINGETAEIIGVMPEGFQFPFNQDLWVPYRVDPQSLSRRGGVSMQVAGYLKEGVSLDAAGSEVAAIARRIEAAYPEENEGISATVMPYSDAYMPDQVSMMMYLLMAMVAGVLLVACANVANVLLARASVREKEVAIRTALGASRGRVVRQLLAEAVVLGVVGGLVGLGFAYGALDWFSGTVAGVDKPYWITFELDGLALLFTSGVALVAAMAAGTVPALRASGGSMGVILRDESRGSSSLRMGRFSSGLVVTELAVSCGLMIAAGLLVRSLVDMNRMDMGFDVAPVMTARLGLFETDYPDAEARSRFYHQLVERMTSEPGVEAASLSSSLPATWQNRWSVEIEGETYATEADLPETGGKTVTVGYFETFGVPFLEGRGFRLSESQRGGEPVAVVNRSFVERHLGGGGAVGRRIRLEPDFDEGEEGEAQWLRIVGVVPDLYQGVGFFGSGDQLDEMVYRPQALGDARFMSLAVRTRGSPAAFVPTLRRTVTSVDPNLPLYWVRTMRESLDQTTFLHRIFGTLFSVFGAAALFLAAVGLYGVIDYSVSARIREMGVRIAFGADRRDVLGLVYRRVLKQLAVGMGLGIALGMVLSQPMAATLVGVREWDPVVYGTIVLTLGLTAVTAALMPAIRAISVDPVEALRAE